MADPIAWGLTYKQGKKLSDMMDGFIDDATEVVEKLGMGLPPRDLVAFTAQSTEDGIQLSFTPPGATYLPEHTASDGKQFACMPAGVLIRYSDTGYPRTPEDGILGYNYKPTGDWTTTAQTCDIVGLTKDTKYYFTAFPYSTEHVYNKNQAAANRAEMTWVGNKGTISVNVQLPAGYTGTLGEYTITLVDQATEGGENITRTATGVGVTRIGGLVAGKTYKVQLSSTDDLQAPPLSDAITIVGGVNNDVTMTYALLYGTIKVNVTTEPTGMPIGAYTVTLTPNDGSSVMTQQGNNSQAVTFSGVKNGVTYTVGLSAINHYTANTGGTVIAVGGQEILHNAHYGWNNPGLDNLSWSEIEKINQTGNAANAFGIGAKKSLTKPKGVNAVLVHASSTRGVFCTDTKVFTTYLQSSTDNWMCWDTSWTQYSCLKKILDKRYNKIFDSELIDIAKTVSIMSSAPEQSSDGEMHAISITTSQKFYIPSSAEVGFSGVPKQYGSAFSYFTDDSRRKSMGAPFATRSIKILSYNNQALVGVSSTGKMNEITGDSTYASPLCFEI